jgi:hypothetical protein
MEIPLGLPARIARAGHSPSYLVSLYITFREVEMFRLTSKASAKAWEASRLRCSNPVCDVLRRGTPNPAGSLGSVFAPHILDTNEAKEKDSDSVRRDASDSWRLDAAGTRVSAET